MYLYRIPASLVIGLLLLVYQDARSAEIAEKSEYDARVAKANLEKEPANHKSLADWCKRKYPEKHQFHLEAWQRHEFARAEKGLPAKPALMELQRLSNLATKMGLTDKAKEYHGKWGEAQFADFAKRLQPGNISMMKQLLDWAMKQKVEFIAPCQELARRIIDEEPDFVPARQALKHLKLAKGWVSLEEALAGIDLQHAPDRVEIHRAMEAYRIPKDPGEYPPDPTRSMERHRDGYFRTATKTRAAPYFVWTRDYSRTKPCPLVISLHGGGEGGQEKSIADAPIEAKLWQHYVKEGSWVLISPTVKNHIGNSWWNEENLEDAFDMIDETLEDFHIDRKRIYITGTSMGGNGTGGWMWVFPELAAASCARSGSYLTTWKNIRDVLGKPILVIHGEKDEGFRNKSRDEYVRKTREFGGVVTHVSYPDQDHFLKPESVYPVMIPFFLKHQNTLEPDFTVLRAVFRDRHKKYPQAK